LRGEIYRHDDLHTLHGVPGSAFEVVDISLMTDTDENRPVLPCVSR
jgi:hypothetical protein